MVNSRFVDLLLDATGASFEVFAMVWHTVLSCDMSGELVSDGRASKREAALLEEIVTVSQFISVRLGERQPSLHAMAERVAGTQTESIVVTTEDEVRKDGDATNEPWSQRGLIT